VFVTRVLFVADQFADATRSRVERHAGGAELTDEAAIRACPWQISTTTFRNLNHRDEQLAKSDVIIVGNSETATPDQLLSIARTGRHVTFEHDLRICRWRGNFPSGRDVAHRMLQRCWCPHLTQRELFDRARGAIFLTRLQESYYRRNPFFACPATHVLGSSLFGRALLDAAAATASMSHERAGASVFASPHPVKGYRQALRYCRKRGLVAREIRGLSPAQVLEHFAASRRFVYLPIGPEWAGRMLVEARLLGCGVVTNELVGVAGEDFWQGDRSTALSFLADGPRRFWGLVEQLMNRDETSNPRPERPLETVAEKLSGLLRAPKVCFWPVGPGPLHSARVHEYAAW